MSVLSTYLINKLLEHQFRATAYVKPTVLYVGLISAVSNVKTGVVTELTGGAYARVACAPSDTNWSAVDALGKTSNLISLTFPTATVTWATATHFGLWDASSGGNLLICSSLATPKTVTATNAAVFGIGTLVVQLDG